jgi:hypothetical protein
VTTVVLKAVKIQTFKSSFVSDLKGMGKKCGEKKGRIQRHERDTGKGERTCWMKTRKKSPV